MQNRKNIHYVILILGAIGAATLVMLFLHFRLINKQQIYNQTLMASDLAIPVSIASTPAQQQQGLSGTAALPSNAGKLFIFDTSGNYGFWMKDMNYGLDFVWIDSAMKIAAITPNVAADTYPKIFYPPQPIQYVLEVNAGFSTQYNLKVGQQLVLKK